MSNPKRVLPAGYRYLRAGAKIVQGDLFDYRNINHPGVGRWSQCRSSVGMVHGANDDLPYKDWVVITNRPIKKRAPKPKAVVDFTPESIIVGRKYRNTEHPKALFLGCRATICRTNGVNNGHKFMVVLKGQDSIGHQCWYEKAYNQSYWNNFVPCRVKP